MKQNLNNIRAEKFTKERTYNSRILLFLFIGIIIALLFMAALNARTESIEKFKSLELENIKYSRQVVKLLKDKKDLMKKLIASKEIEMKSLLEKTIYFEAVKLKNRSEGGIMKPAYLGLQRKQ